MRLLPLCFAGATIVAAAPAFARPNAPELFCARYPQAPACLAGQLVACQTCHVEAGTTKLNPFGADVRGVLSENASSPFTDQDFEDYLDGALGSVEALDSDDDGTLNLEEIEKGSYPGSATSLPSEPTCPDDPSQYEYTFCQYDHDFAFGRVAIDFCGVRPTYEELQSFRAMDLDGRKEALHAKLDECLLGEFWRGAAGQLTEMAHRKIRPVQGLQAFADFAPDYSLFVWANTDDRNVQDILLAQYLVTATPGADGETVYQMVDTIEGQPLVQSKRAGLLTTSWMLFYNTMFTAIPRSTAAQAYRAYLNLDIAMQEGLTYETPDPVDYDGAGVTADGCIGCHRTIEALARPFTRYNGLQAANGTTFFEYDVNRMGALGLPQVPEAGSILGQPVDDLIEWAKVAADSDEFFQAVTEDYWKLLVGKAPTPEDLDAFEEYTALWGGLSDDDGHVVKTMLHALIDTEAYGAP